VANDAPFGYTYKCYYAEVDECDNLVLPDLTWEVVHVIDLMPGCNTAWVLLKRENDAP
jgi:hypothetical protein